MDTPQLKTTLAVTVVAALGPLAGELALILLGAFGGGLLALQNEEEPMPRWWQPIVYVGANMLAGLMFATVASAITVAVLPAAWGVSVDMLWTPVAALVAMYWRQAAGALPLLIDRFGR